MSKTVGPFVEKLTQPFWPVHLRHIWSQVLTSNSEKQIKVPAV